MVFEQQKLELIQLILTLQDPQLLTKIEQFLKTNTSQGKSLSPVVPQEKSKRKYGFAKGMTLYVAPDFDETPPGFEEYMPNPA